MVQEDMFNDSETPHKTSEAVLLHSKKDLGDGGHATHGAVQRDQCTQLSLKNSNDIFNGAIYSYCDVFVGSQWCNLLLL